MASSEYHDSFPPSRRELVTNNKSIGTRVVVIVNVLPSACDRSCSLKAHRLERVTIDHNRRARLHAQCQEKTMTTAEKERFVPVWLARNPRFLSRRRRGSPRPRWPRDYQLAGFVLAADVQEAFGLTQGWPSDPRVIPLIEARSVSIDDVLLTPAGNVFRCEPRGWSQL